jgi:hypothetical protein
MALIPPSEHEITLSDVQIFPIEIALKSYACKNYFLESLRAPKVHPLGTIYDTTLLDRFTCFQMIALHSYALNIDPYPPSGQA